MHPDDHLSPERREELEAEAAAFWASQEGRALSAQLQTALEAAGEPLGLPAGSIGDEDAWWGAAARLLSPAEFGEFVDALEPGSIKALVYLRTRAEDARRQAGEDRPAKPGPIPRTHAQKARARQDWNRVKHLRELTLEEWLGERYGYHPDGSPKVARRTFYDWPEA